jgi:hypothetical protein
LGSLQADGVARDPRLADPDGGGGREAPPALARDEDPQERHRVEEKLMARRYHRGGGVDLSSFTVWLRHELESGLYIGSMLIPAFLLGSFEKLLGYVMFTDTLTLAVVASTLFVLRLITAA